MIAVERKMRVKIGKVTFKDRGVAKKLATLPKNAHLLEIKIGVPTAFNGTGTDLLSVGTKADDDAYVNDFDVASAVVPTTATLLVGGQLGGGGGVTEVWGTYADSNSNATAGEANVYLIYCTI